MNDEMIDYTSYNLEYDSALGELVADKNLIEVNREKWIRKVQSKLRAVADKIRPIAQFMPLGIEYVSDISVRLPKSWGGDEGYLGVVAEYNDWPHLAVRVVLPKEEGGYYPILFDRPFVTRLNRFFKTNLFSLIQIPPIILVTDEQIEDKAAWLANGYLDYIKIFDI